MEEDASYFDLFTHSARIPIHLKSTKGKVFRKRHPIKKKKKSPNHNDTLESEALYAEEEKIYYYPGYHYIAHQAGPQQAGYYGFNVYQRYN